MDTVQNPGTAERPPRFSSRLCAVAGVTIALGLAALPAGASDPVSEWNRIAAQKTLTASPALAPVAQTRAMAIVQVSVHDAVSGITGAFETYLAPPPAPLGASPEAAAIAAAHHALKALFGPAQAASLDADYAASLATWSIAPNDPGLEFGRQAAAAILAIRQDDGASQAQFAYVVPNMGAPGVWEIQPANALLPGWGQVRPWVLRTGAQFRPDAPPALDSEQYVRDVNEVQAIGRATTVVTSRTQIATFWRASPTAIWNSVLNQILDGRGLDIPSTARTFAVFYLAAADASIAVWEAKYFYNFWRPQRAIRRADELGNPLMVSEPGWEPFLPTPPHPEYPSAHTANSGAMVHVMTRLFGDSPGPELVVSQGGITRRWDTCSEALAEVIDARVYSGIHFRTADVVGARLGRQVAQFVMTHALRSAKLPRPTP